MKRVAGLALVLAVAGVAAAQGTEVELDGLKSKAPAGWKAEEPRNPPNMKSRVYQFKLPKADGDKADAELIVFHFGPGGGGGVADNVKRWKGMVKPPAGKSEDEAAKVETMKVGEVPVTYLDAQGTYLMKTRPFDPNDKGTEMSDYRLIGVVFESPKGPYFMRLVGPAKTVEKHKKDFDGWLKNFK